MQEKEHHKDNVYNHLAPFLVAIILLGLTIIAAKTIF